MEKKNHFVWLRYIPGEIENVKWILSEDGRGLVINDLLFLYKKKMMLVLNWIVSLGQFCWAQHSVRFCWEFKKNYLHVWSEIETYLELWIFIPYIAQDKARGIIKEQYQLIILG